MAQTVSNDTIWTILAAVLSLVVVGVFAYLYLVAAKPLPVQSTPRTFTTTGIQAMEYNSDKNFRGNVFVRMQQSRQQVADSPESRDTLQKLLEQNAVGKSDLSQ